MARTISSAPIIIQDANLSTQLEDGEQVLWEGRSDTFAGNEDKSKDLALLVVRALVVVTSPFAVSVWDTYVWEWISALWIGVYAVSLPFLGMRVAEAAFVKYQLTNRRIVLSTQPGSRPSRVRSIERDQLQLTQYWCSRTRSITVEYSTATGAWLNDSSKNVAAFARRVAQARGRLPDDLTSFFASCSTDDLFQGILGPDETILWQGRPERRSFLRGFWGWWGGIVLYPAIAWIALLSAIDFSQVQPLWTHIAKILPFIILASWFVRKRYLERLENAASEFYAVTNQRLIVRDWSSHQFFAEAELAQTQTMKREEFASGAGTISFGGKSNDAVEFSLLDNPGEVREIIDAAKQQISGIAMKWIDVAAERAKGSKPI